jgi:hypothetical protein
VESGKYINVKKGSKVGRKKIGLSVIGSGEVKKQPMFLRHATHHPLLCPFPPLLFPRPDLAQIEE